MNCRPGCAACCIAPSINSSIPNMPDGKAAMEPCKNLTAEGLCMIHGQGNYPDFCRGLKADPEMCGFSREDALKFLYDLEIKTAAKAEQ